MHDIDYSYIFFTNPMIDKPFLAIIYVLIMEIQNCIISF